MAKPGVQTAFLEVLVGGRLCPVNFSWDPAGGIEPARCRFFTDNCRAGQNKNPLKISLLCLSFEAWIKREQNPNQVCFKFTKAKITPACLPLITMCFFLTFSVSPTLNFSDFTLKGITSSLGLSGSSMVDMIFLF